MYNLIQSPQRRRPVPAPPKPVIPPKNIIGIWYQPVSSFAKWKSLGINTLIGYESEGGTVSMATWKAAARAMGLCYICGTSGNPKLDATDQYLLAFFAGDEPDGAGNQTPAQMQVIYDHLHHACPHTPVMINFDSWQMKWKPQSLYVEYMKACDWASVDCYPYNGGQLQSIADMGARLDELSICGPGKKIFAFIECSDQKLGEASWAQNVWVDANNNLYEAPGPGLVTVASRMQPPTPSQMIAEVAMVKDHKAVGIFYFADVIGNGWLGFDGTTPDLCQAMVKANATY